MKRTRTKLEENLIEKGYNLNHKTYKGKNSDRVENYSYQKNEFDNECIVVLLDSKRITIVKVSLYLSVPFVVDKTQLKLLNARYSIIKEEVYGCLPKGEENESGE